MQKNIDKSTSEDIIAGTERNGTERNGTERNGTERKRKSTLKCRFPT